MTISTQTARVQYNGNGVTTVFPVTFEFLGGAELLVVLTDAAGAADTVKTLTTHYTVSGGGATQPATGSVTMLTAPASGELLTILRAEPLTQAASYTPLDPFPAKTHEKALDRLEMQVQMLKERSDRALKLRASTALTNIDFPLPGAGRLVGWNADGTQLENRELESDLLNQAVAAAAMAELWGGIAQGSVPNVFVTSRAAMKLLSTASTINAWFDGDQWSWVASSFATILRTLVGTATADAGTDTLTDADHGLETGIALLCNSTLNGVTANTLVYAVVTDKDNYKLASTYPNAVASSPTIIDLTGSSNMTMYRHNDPAQGIIVTKTGDITGAQGAWVRDNYALRDWEWRWFGAVDSTGTTGADQAQAINAWMAAANAIKPRMSYMGIGLFAHDSRIHHPTHIVGLRGTRSGLRLSSLYRRFSEPNGPSIVSTGISTASDYIACPGHPVTTGMELIVTVGTTDFAVNTLYYGIYRDANSYQLASTKANAFAGVPIDITVMDAVTVQQPSKRGNLGLTDWGGDIRGISFQAKTDGSISGGAGLSAILSKDALRVGDLYIDDNYIAPGLGANFSLVVDGSANVSPEPGGVGSNGQRDVRGHNNIVFASRLGSGYFNSVFGVDIDSSFKGNITGGGDAPALIITGQPDNRSTNNRFGCDVALSGVLLDYVEDTKILGDSRGAVKNTAEVKNFSIIGENLGASPQQNWVGKSGFSLNRRSDHFKVGPFTEGSSEVSIGNVIRNDGVSLSKVSGTGTNAHMIFYNDALGTPTEIGRISSNGSTTTYATSSDMWRKDDRGEMSAELAIQILWLMKFHEFDWIVNGQRDYGVFAQELHEVYPAAVPVQGGWELDEDGNAQYVPWMVDYSKLIPVLGRAMQVMLHRQDAFETRLLAIEAR